MHPLNILFFAHAAMIRIMAGMDHIVYSHESTYDRAREK